MDFWSSFLAGVASALAVGLLAMVIRKFFRRSEEEPPLKFNRRTLGTITLGIIMVAAVGAIIVLALKGLEIPGTLYGIFILSGMWFYWLL